MHRCFRVVKPRALFLLSALRPSWSAQHCIIAHKTTSNMKVPDKHRNTGVKMWNTTEHIKGILKTSEYDKRTCQQNAISTALNKSVFSVKTFIQSTKKSACTLTLRAFQICVLWLLYCDMQSSPCQFLHWNSKWLGHLLRRNDVLPSKQHSRHHKTTEGELGAHLKNR